MFKLSAAFVLVLYIVPIAYSQSPEVTAQVAWAIAAAKQNGAPGFVETGINAAQKPMKKSSNVDDLSFAEIYSKSLKERKPVAVWVGYACASSEVQLPSMIHWHTKAPWKDITEPTVVVLQPYTDGFLYREGQVKASSCSADSIMRILNPPQQPRINLGGWGSNRGMSGMGMSGMSISGMQHACVGPG